MPKLTGSNIKEARNVINNAERHIINTINPSKSEFQIATSFKKSIKAFNLRIEQERLKSEIKNVRGSGSSQNQQTEDNQKENSPKT